MRGVELIRPRNFAGDFNPFGVAVTLGRFPTSVPSALAATLSVRRSSATPGCDGLDKYNMKLSQDHEPATKDERIRRALNGAGTAIEGKGWCDLRGPGQVLSFA